MPLVSLARFEIRPDAREDAERAMHEYASYVRRELPRSSWTAYRDRRVPARYVAVTHADDPKAAETHRDAAGTRAFVAALAPLTVAPLDEADFDLVTSSDLQRRHRPAGRAR